MGANAVELPMHLLKRGGVDVERGGERTRETKAKETKTSFSSSSISFR